MTELSDHTLQINAWIALTRRDTTFSTTLADLGYECSVIEQPIYSADEIVRPDIILASPENDHAAVVECKSAKLDADQLQRYLQLRDEQLVTQAGVGDISPDAIDSDLCLSSFVDLSEEHALPSAFAVVHFDQHPSSGVVLWNVDDYPFSCSPLRNAFPINRPPDTPLPRHYYPFSTEPEDHRALVSKVLQSAISLAVTQGEFTVEEVLRQAHPYWKAFSNDEQEHLRRRGRQVLYELRDKGLEDHLDVIADTDGYEWRRISPSIRSIADNTDYYVDKVTDAIQQRTLSEFEDAEDVGS